MEEKSCPMCHSKHTERDTKFVSNLDSRLNRIIGQLNGIKNMIDSNRYCGDILIQISAIESSLQQVGYLILEDHLETCVREKVLDNDDEVMKETVSLIKKLK